ncbi:spore coat U domain-containing protein [Rhodoferax ferrireducens]|uniref:Csu type fimbrial protein n=1 Tax=Rhodoferax ferrireducens TaxID=192843 RepID=UPI003BB48F1D
MSSRFQIVAVLLTLGANIAVAATTTTNLNVTATVSATCSVTTSAVAFGTYDPTSASPKDATGSATVTCTSGTTYSIALDAGAHESTPGDASTRRMLANTADYLPYTLYLDSGHTTIWGDGANGTSVNPSSGTFTGDGTDQSYSVYGRIAAGQYVAAGSYSDAVVTTVTYN